MYVLFVVAILEEYCMSSADSQCLFYSGERIMVHRPLVCLVGHFAVFVDWVVLQTFVSELRLSVAWHNYSCGSWFLLLLHLFNNGCFCVIIR